MDELISRKKTIEVIQNNIDYLFNNFFKDGNPYKIMYESAFNYVLDLIKYNVPAYVKPIDNSEESNKYHVTISKDELRMYAQSKDALQEAIKSLLEKICYKE